MSAPLHRSADPEQDALRTARASGTATSLLGVALLLAPRRVGPLAGIADAREARWLGATDLAVGPGLLVGRPLWPWLAARTVLDVGHAAVLVRRGRRGRLTALTLLANAVSDGRAAAALYRARR